MSQLTVNDPENCFDEDLDDADTNPLDRTDSFDLLLRAVDGINISSVWRVTSENLGRRSGYLISHKKFCFQFKINDLNHAQLLCSILNVIAGENSSFQIGLKGELGFGSA